jgi:hypothetical protein
VDVDTAAASGSTLGKADVVLEQWVATFLTFAQSLSPTTVQTYRRDLDRYVLPRFGAVRLGRLYRRRSRSGSTGS